MYKLLLLACIATSLVMTSCNKDETEETVMEMETPEETVNTMSMKIDGVLFEPENIFAKDYGIRYNYTIYGITETSFSDIEDLSLFVDTYEVGSYALGISNDTGVHAQYSREFSSGALYQDTNGTITIDSHNSETKNITGRFEFEAVN